VETYRELAASLTDLYLSSVSYRMNEIMKVLTIFTAIFIPLSFIAGLYGMNFEHEESPLNMPELEWYFGYPFVLALMAVIAGGLLYYFWRRGWIGRARVAVHGGGRAVSSACGGGPLRSPDDPVSPVGTWARPA
jgi:magnesium transporter